MSSYFLPRFINGPFNDPGLFIHYPYEKQAVIFDLGDIHALSAKDVLKISHVFITHTHVDHFIGFDRLLRLFLGREKMLFLYGPQGFLKNLEGRLSGYTWNLVDKFSNCFVIQATEIRPGIQITNQFPCRNRFIPVQRPIHKAFTDILLDEPGLVVSAEILDHGIPCLGFRFKERFHINIIKEGLSQTGLEPGLWLNDFKQALFSHMDPGSVFHVPDKKAPLTGKTFKLGDLSDRIARITRGRCVAYIADAAYTPPNIHKMTRLAKEADHLYIEAAFLEKDRDMAKRKYHLTARQAGSIAGGARVKKFTVFHFSPRYTGKGDLLQQEAEKAYETYGA